MRQYFAVLSFSFVLLTFGDSSFGQGYPQRPIRVLTPEVGGGTDLVTRLVAQAVAASLGQQLVVDNRPANSLVGLTIKSLPDGYTLLSLGPVVWIEPLLRERVGYDPVRDLSPISSLARSFNILVVHPSVPAKSVKELIALARAKPGSLNYGYFGTGKSGQLAAELFNRMANVNIVAVDYKGGGAGISALIAGEVQLIFAASGSVVPQIQAGRLRALGISSAQATSLFPDLPTIAASGLPGYESSAIYAMFAPAKTPAPIIKRLNQEVIRALNTPEVREKFALVGVETAPSTPEELAAFVKSEMTKWGKVIKEAGIRID